MDWDKFANQVLREAGWYPERVFDISGYITALQSEGLLIHLLAAEALKSYGGLHLKWVTEWNNKTLPRKMHFDAEWAALDFHPKLVENCAKVANVPLMTPIGEAANYNSLILMDEEAKIYTCMNFYLSFVGTSIERGIVNIIKHPHDTEGYGIGYVEYPVID